MTIKESRIVQATENELFALYLGRGYDDIMPFDQYVYMMERAGCKVQNKTCLSCENVV